MEKPCPRCLKLARKGRIRSEAIMPLRGGAADAMALDGTKHCIDCEAAEHLHRRGGHPDFTACRIATANDRQEMLRLPGLYGKFGLSFYGITKEYWNSLDEHHEWLDKAVPGWQEIGS